MWDKAVIDMILVGIGETLYMTLASTIMGYVFGMPLGIALAVTDKTGIRPNAEVYKILDFISNIIRRASTFTIIFKVLLVEARTSILVGATIAIGTILGYSAMAGTVGGGGLGDIAIRYGYHRYQVDIMVVTVILLIVLVQIFQTIGMHIANKIDRRKR